MDKLKSEPKRFFVDSKYFSWIVPEEWKVEETAKIENKHVSGGKVDVVVERIEKKDNKKAVAIKVGEGCNPEKAPWLVAVSIDENAKIVGRFKKFPKEKREVLILNVIESGVSTESDLLDTISKVYSRKGVAFINYDRTAIKAADYSVSTLLKNDKVWSKDWFKGSDEYIAVNPIENFLIFPYVSDPFIDFTVVVTSSAALPFLRKYQDKIKRVFVHQSIFNELSDISLNNVESFSNPKELERTLAVVSALEEVNFTSEDEVVVHNERQNLNISLSKGHDIAIYVNEEDIFLNECKCFSDVVSKIVSNEFSLISKWSLVSRYEMLVLNKEYKEFILRAVKSGAKVDIVYV